MFDSCKKTLAAAALTLMATNVYAQNAGEIEEVLVTATKRAGSVQDIPAAIDVYTPDQLSDVGITSINDLSSISSGFRMNESTGTSSIFIRGIGTSIQGNTTDISTAVFIDGVLQSRNYALGGLVTELTDVTSVQILKGPQGTLYGRNATGGALVLETYTPDVGDEFNGRVRVTAGDFGLFRASARISGGIGDNFAASLGVATSEKDGFHEVFGPQEDGLFQDGEAFQLKLRWQPSDTADLVFTGVYIDEAKGDQSLQQIGHTDADPALGVPPGLNNAQTAWFGVITQFLPQLGINLDPFDPTSQFGTVFGMAAGLQFPTGADSGYYSNGVNSWQNGLYPLVSDQINSLDAPGATDIEYTSFSLKGTFNFDAFDVVSITSYNETLTNSTAPDLLGVDPASLPNLGALNTAVPGYGAGIILPDGTPFDAVVDGTLAVFSTGNIGFSGFANSEAVIQEVYLVSTDSDIEWIVGGLYFTEDFNSGNTNDAFGTSSVGAFNDFEVNSLSVYGEVTFPINDTFSLTGGLRYSDDDNELNDLVGTLTPAQNAAGIPDEGTIKVADEQLTYNLRLNYQRDNLLVYGGVTTGYKSGLINSGNPSTGAADPEEITSFEIGFKSQLADNALQFNGSAFFYDYDNLQLNILDVNRGSTVVVNGAVAEVLGLELDAQWLVGENTTLFANTTILDHEFTDNAILPGAIQPAPIVGNKLPMTADAALVVGLQHNIPTGAGEFGLNLSANYNSGYWFNQANTVGTGSDGDEDDAFTTANASVTFLSNDGVWRVTAFINNLTDEEYFSGGISAFGGLLQNGVRGHPRNAGLTLEVNF